MLHQTYLPILQHQKQFSSLSYHSSLLSNPLMAEALLEFVAENLLSFGQEELATILGVESRIEMLSSYLTTIRAVLRDAEEKQLTSHADDTVKVWLKNLSDAAHVLDDILDSCSIQSKLLRSHNITCLSPKSILFRRDIGKRMKEIVKRFQDIDEERKRFELRGVIRERQQEDDREWRQTCSVITEDHIYGRDQDRDKIVEFLLRHDGESNELSVYPIVGMGGHGKTTLARLVFNDGRVSEQFDPIIWVCVSNNFDVTRILQSIVESTVGINPNLSTLESMQKKVKEVLSGKKYLLVLDDVWNKDEAKWKTLKGVLQCGTNGASVLVTTRLVDVASIMGTCQTHHDLSPLSEDDSWSLFKQHAFGPNKEERAELVAIGKDILKKCKGSPLASKVLGRLLSVKDEVKQWLSVKESKFWDILHGDESDDIMRVLMISYFDLSMSLRRCFSFCAIYPEDSEISKEQLIHLWMANGLIKPKGKLEVEDVGNDVWEGLRQRLFFQEVKTDFFGNTSFKIHDLFHELAQSIMGEECQVSKLENMKNLSKKVHHITCPDFYKPFNLSTDVLKKFESLRTFVELCPSFSSYELKAFNSVRALSMSSSQLSGLGSLTHLRYLNIHHSEITTLPECVSRLQRLQILKLEDCKYLVSLPKQLTQLTELRHLLIRGCWSLVEMPPNIGELKRLKTLNVYVVESKRGLSLTELHGLQLGGKLHIKGLENARSESEARRANLKSKKELSQLYLSWGSSSNPKCTNAEEILEALEPHGSLKSFGMKGYMGKRFPSWMMTNTTSSVLSCLVSVILYKCENCEQLPPLGKLPHLANLVVCGMRDLKYMDDDSYDGVEEKAFKSLKKLTLSRLPNLERMLRDETVEMLPLLSELSLCCVPKLRLPLLSSVERLKIEGWKPDSDHDSMDSFLEAIVPSFPHVKALRIEKLSGLNLNVSLGSLNSLQELDISECDELESFKESVLQGLSSLRTLRIIWCSKLKSLPEGVEHLTCLENLSIHGCRELVTLPNNMNKLTALRSVDIYGNSTLPEGLRHIPSLKHLTIGGDIDSLPEWLGDMTSLQQILIICCPKLMSLPSSFQHLTNLRVLHIAFCPKLEKWYKGATGEDRLNIAHIPQFEIIPEPKATLINERLQFIWNIFESAGVWEFDKLVDDIEGMLIKTT